MLALNLQHDVVSKSRLLEFWVVMLRSVLDFFVLDVHVHHSVTNHQSVRSAWLGGLVDSQLVSGSVEVVAVLGVAKGHVRLVRRVQLWLALSRHDIGINFLSICVKNWDFSALNGVGAPKLCNWLVKYKRGLPLDS